MEGHNTSSHSDGKSEKIHATFHVDVDIVKALEVSKGKIGHTPKERNMKEDGIGEIHKLGDLTKKSSEIVDTVK